MVKVWLMTENVTDPRDECQQNPPHPLGLDELAEIGVLYYYVPEKSGMEQIAKDRGYDYRDEVTINREKLPNYEDKIKQFFEEHLHTDEEIRYIMEGRGYFDVRNKEDKWVRILSEPGDLLILPAGIYHRFTPDHNDYIFVTRLFRGLPVWEAHNRSVATDHMVERKAYIQDIQCSH